MKQNVKKIVALTLALTVLVSSHSFAYFEHICKITQKKTYSFDLETCAGPSQDSEDTGTTFKKGTCCEVNLKTNKGGTAIQQDFSFGISPILFGNVPINDFCLELFEGFLLDSKIVHGYANSSPPLKLPIYLLNDQFII